MITLKKYVSLYGVFLRNCLQAQMEYRLNFLFSILAELGWVCSHLLYLMVLYSSGVNIDGLSPDVLFLFTGSYLITTGIYMSLFYTNFANIPNYIRTGELDLFLTKPVSLQFIATLRYSDFGYPIADFAAGLLLIIIGWQRVGVSLSIVNLLGFLGFTLLGALWVYVLQMIPALIAFWTTMVNGLYSISSNVYDMNKMPRSVYGEFIQRIGTFVFPLFPMANYGTLFLMGRLHGLELIWGLCGPILFFLLSIFVWRVASRRYTSASS